MSMKAKHRQSAKHKKSGKYDYQFARTVNRTGRWRGKIIAGFERVASEYDARIARKRFGAVTE